MDQLEAARRLVKSAPELWETCSDADSLNRHLQAFGEIKITRLEPETTVAWEGESASGTVELEPSGWGTKVTLRARAVTGMTAEIAAVPKPSPAPEPSASAPAPPPEPEPAPVTQSTSAAPPPSAPLRPAAPAPSVKRRQGGFVGLLRDVLFGRPQPAQQIAAPASVAEPVVASEPVAAPEPAVAPEPVAASEPAVAPEPAATSDWPEPPEPVLDTLAALEAALDSLGQAHHRPFSRG